jgi:hypothetical protein
MRCPDLECGLYPGIVIESGHSENDMVFAGALSNQVSTAIGTKEPLLPWRGFIVL